MVPATTKRARIRVTGLVQGVYYRASARERALDLGVSGWVQNTPDGAVELEAHGLADAVDRLIAWCHEGPPGARVREVIVDELPAYGSGAGDALLRAGEAFVIKR